MAGEWEMAGISEKAGVYELPLSHDDLRPPLAQKKENSTYFPLPLVIANARWFCRLRWVVIVILAAYGTLGFFQGVFGRIGLQPRYDWPFTISTFLAVGNLAFLADLRKLADTPTFISAKRNLWAQIVFDLVLLTAVVHYVGSLETYAPYVYLFHIVLACIFFPRRVSLAVTLFAFGLYASCLLLETFLVLPPASIYVRPELRSAITGSPLILSITVISKLLIWLVVWYLASHLSDLVRQRDRALADTNRRLVEVQLEKQRHMLRTTHELKAPFAAIHANTQLLLKGYCGELPEKALDVVARIGQRSRGLSMEIQEMLQLANLRSMREDALPWASTDLAESLRKCTEQIGPLLEEREVLLETDIQPAVTVGVEEHLLLVLSNILANAVVYSCKGGKVEVSCRQLNDGAARVKIKDNGIGIAHAKLDKIFDEYYRTDEAARHNKVSSGLGLAIVKHVANSHKIGIRVESETGAGTTFVLNFPAPSEQVCILKEED